MPNRLKICATRISGMGAKTHSDKRRLDEDYLSRWAGFASMIQLDMPEVIVASVQRRPMPAYSQTHGLPLCISPEERGELEERVRQLDWYAQQINHWAESGTANGIRPLIDRVFEVYDGQPIFLANGKLRNRTPPNMRLQYAS
jgi:hypothetical protein